MNPVLGLAFGMLLIRVLFDSGEARATADTEDRDRAARIARRKARRAKREAKNRNANSGDDSQGGNTDPDQPAT
jgi:hypothetical protein